MPKQPADDLQVLIARLRAAGGKVSPNVVSGHNVTAPDGTEVRFHSTRATFKGQPTPGRAKLLGHLRELLGDREERRNVTPHREDLHDFDL